MRKVPLIRPLYAEKFRCIGPECEASCCVGWQVWVDEASCRKYQKVPESPLRVLLDSAIVRTPANADGSPAPNYASIKMLDSGACPFWNDAGLCKIHAELGEEYLSDTCRTFPRAELTIDGRKEESLSLSCPEAARLVLLDPKLVDLNPVSGLAFSWNEQSEASLLSHFWVLRDFTIRLVLNRKYPLWQRLYLLGAFSRRLEALQRGEINRPFVEVLDGFAQALNQGGLGQAMEGIQPDLNLQLWLLIHFLEMRTQKAMAHAPRLVEVLDAFINGVGVQQGTDFATNVERYRTAYRDVFQPFMEKHPHILENYLINQIFRQRFPVGDHSLQPGNPVEIEKNYELLVIQFALTKGLLIGFAGHFGDRFDAGHVVKVVQTVTRHFEHDPTFLAQAHAFLKERNMNDARGLAMLVRN